MSRGCDYSPELLTPELSVAQTSLWLQPSSPIPFAPEGSGIGTTRLPNERIAKRE